MKKLLILALASFTLMGCTATTQTPTHKWTAQEKSLARSFRINNNSCAQTALSVKAYEQCMQDHGYTLKLASR